MKSPNLTFRPFQNGDQKGILKLFELVFKKPLSIEQWEWRFAKNPFGETKIFLACNQDVIVGHYAVSPIKINVDGVSHLFAHSLTTMINPDYWGQGLFTELASHLYRKLENEGYAGVWGYPNQNSYYGMVKRLGWKPIGSFPFLYCNTSGGTACGIANEISQIDEPTEAIINNYNRSQVNGVFRDKKYFDWRFGNDGGQNYQRWKFVSGGKVRGFFVTKTYTLETQKSCDVVELITDSAETYFDALTWIRRSFLTDQNFERVNIWCNIHSENYLTLLKADFKMGAPLTYMGGVLFKSELESFFDFTKWQTSMSDSDVF